MSQDLRLGLFVTAQFLENSLMKFDPAILEDAGVCCFAVEDMSELVRGFGWATALGEKLRCFEFFQALKQVVGGVFGQPFQELI